MQASNPIVKDLVLIGGGHTHAIALRMFGMKPLPGVRITLITEASDTPYSGMLPGHVAGFYSREECHIDLRRLAQFAQVQLYIDQAIGLDLENKQVICARRPPVAFDAVSIDIGSTPATIAVPGATEHAIPAKPISKLLAHWDQFITNVKQNPQQSIRIGVIGGGAGGVELTLSLQSHLQRILSSPHGVNNNLEIHLFHRDAELMPTYNRWVRHRFQKILQRRKVQLHLQETVSEVQPHKVVCKSGLKVECDRIFWVTQASAPKWLRESGLTTDANGFVQVNDYLQSISHPDVFAAGDIATMIDHPRPKAGVFAVRQGKPLFENLQRSLQEKSLKPYKPQKQYLSLIGTGNGKAIAARGSFGFGPSQLLWRWKDWIDRRFMQRFSDVPQMNPEVILSSPHPTPRTASRWASPRFANANTPHPSTMHCAGCGSKVGSTVLAHVLQRIEQPLTCDRQDILIGLDAPDDAAVVQVPANFAMVHTIDYFRALINDPYLFGQISANHCLSDIFAMGAVPQSALAIATIPYAIDAKVAETLFQLLSGAVKVLAESNTPLVGGHTTEGAELSFGLSCNGLVHPDKLLRKSGMQPGQVLILTKALGTGTLFAAQMRQKAKGKWIDTAVESMLLSNAAAATCFLEHEATACTDITGFGLLGHLMEMIQASHVAIELQMPAIPILDGAIETTQQGIVSSLHSENLRVSHYISNLDQVENHHRYPLLFDPQTSGGLLAALPQHKANECIAVLQKLGYPDCQIIGEVKILVEKVNPVTLVC
ncbi:selenide, water dikinase SelD [Gloeocapsopsis dulcis]|uniref:Selenide, water dikinase SelD n=1 Tax=Gloeocapsopsis dulcis AAB1 = 1H9 TaxID=1433147 RepID=A0A6N8FYP9_9CHRO|nr:selenide, water dikinase SelD [Gloeocapsopsis dulcis]MUL37465.1 selenide, water dikinase SelD [Gloeocapsopsis dulcis AAB1 = 1H9]WNN89519.1 selenide, water dikinase SelD [Gloeocapsopsis dulcis]